MSSQSEQDRVRELAERVARRLADAPRAQGGEGGGDLAALRASLSEIQRRLAHIESHITHGEDCADGTAKSAEQSRGAARQSPSSAPSTRSTALPAQAEARPTWLSGTYLPVTSHPSHEQFAGLGEAVSELVEFFENEKTCTVEPGGKPCDHCGLCSARGF